MSGKVQNASTHTLQSRVSTRTQQSVSSRDTQFNGALERYTWVRFAAKLTTHCHRHTWQQLAHQWGDGTLHTGSIRRKAHPLPQNAHSKSQHSIGVIEDMSGRFKMQTRTNCGAKITSKRTAVGQFKGSFSEALESNARIRLGKRTHPALPRHAANR